MAHHFVTPQTDIELSIYDFLMETFRQECDDRQRKMGLSYTTEPTIEIVHQITNFAKTMGYIVCETADFLGNLHNNLVSHYVEREDRGFTIMTVETSDLARVVARMVARQLA